MAREINLVPDIKDEMIKALKLRNLIFFLCLVVSAASVGITVVAGITAGGQQLAINNKNEIIDDLSSKLTSYKDLNDFLTIRDQLGGIATLTSNKTVFSRTFNILGAMIPQGADSIQISNLSINLASENPTFTLEAQANAGQPPYIDYNVLESFKKSMQFLKYDYGKYVDKNGNEIPAYCIIESGQDGASFNDPTNGLYALWTINAEGCYNSGNDSSASSDDPATDGDESSNSSSSSAAATDESTDNTAGQEDVMDYDGQKVVRIWRTPQYDQWYKTSEVEGQPYMDLSGNISNVPHFESACITYTGTIDDAKPKPQWEETNENCLLVPNYASEEGIRTFDDSNGRGDDGELVLRFSATIGINPEVYKFDNHHMMALPPSGRRNVTDSYVQIQAMFSERASDCANDDASCKSSNNNNNNNSDNTNNNTNNNNNGEDQNGQRNSN